MAGGAGASRLAEVSRRPSVPTGLALECGGEEGDDRPRRLRASAGIGGVRTTLSFSGDHAVALEELSAVARIELSLLPRLTLFAGGGPILGGTVRTEGTDYQMRTGWLAAGRLSWLALGETARRPFVLASVVLGYAATHTATDGAVPASWRAADARIGLAAGKSFGRLRPYAVARLFGGPVTGSSPASQSRGPTPITTSWAPAWR